MNAIYFDMDGTIANLYGVENWLADLIAEHTRPYREAQTLLNMRKLGRVLNALQTAGYTVGIVSWLSKCGTAEYNERVTATKLAWLAKHLGSVHFDEIHIVPYGTPKQTVVSHTDGILFDDEAQNRENWLGVAYDEKNIMEILENLLTD